MMVMNRLFLITGKLGSFYCLFINYLLVSKLFLLATLQLRTTKDSIDQFLFGFCHVGN